jgi:DNA polymerase III delta prime subunit
MSTTTDISTTDQSYNYYPVLHNTDDHVEEGELESLIRILKYKLKIKDPSVQSIKYPNLLMKSLYELHNLVGMERLKDSIALQVMRLIDAAHNGEKSNRMLNTILYGPPGVGKTKVGIILSKIWYALGYLKRDTVGSGGSGSGTSNQPKINTTTTTYNPTFMSGGNDMNPFITILLLVLFYGFAYIISGVSYIYNTVGFMWLGIIFLTIVAIVFLLYWNKTSYGYITNIVTTKISGQNSNDVFDDQKSGKVNDRDIIKVVSRQDFVADYVGQTATKTKALLYSNLGKVLFIDEAYSLINGDRDPFGMEALTTLNLFMSEHPDQIAIIFAGYKDIMKHGIFRYQPGLPRRCMWHFECDGYDGEQLADIFIRQVHSDGWEICESDYDKIRDVISDNADMFESYGGDTERLVFFSQLEASRTNVMGSSSRSGSKSYYYTSCYGQSDTDTNTETNNCSSSDRTRKILTYEHVQYGLRRLEENNIRS